MDLFHSPEFLWSLCTKPVFYPQQGQPTSIVPALAVCEAHCSELAEPFFTELDLCDTLRQQGWKQTKSRVRLGKWCKYDTLAAGFSSTTLVAYQPPNSSCDVKSEWSQLLIDNGVPHVDGAWSQKLHELQQLVDQAMSEVDSAYSSGIFGFDPPQKSISALAASMIQSAILQP